MPHAKLDPARIRAEALRLFKSDGLEALTARALAKALGVGASSLYWHIPDKRALHAMLTEDIFRECLAAMPPSDDSAGWLRAFGLSLWQAQQAMPDTRKLIMLHPLAPDTATALRSEVIGALLGYGLPARVAERGQCAVQALVTGWTTLGDQSVAGADDSREAFEEALEALIDGWRARAPAA